MDRPGIERIILPVEHLVKEPEVCNGKSRFSCRAWTRKMPKGVICCDFDKKEKSMELELSNGDRMWVDISVFFGVVISEVKVILILYPDNVTESMSIVGIETFKVKRTEYSKLIFERDLPF